LSPYNGSLAQKGSFKEEGKHKQDHYTRKHMRLQVLHVKRQITKETYVTMTTVTSNSDLRVLVVPVRLMPGVYYVTNIWETVQCFP
jgi:hypothetical protein